MRRPNNAKFIEMGIIIVLLLVYPSCGSKTTDTSPSSPKMDAHSSEISPSKDKDTSPISIPAGKESPESPSPSATTQPQQENNYPWVIGKVYIIDATGKPLENIACIATENPNAFDEPIARGNLSGPDGISTIQIPKNKKVFIRAWDPILHYFPNNYFEIQPTDADYLEDMQILMLEASSIELQLFRKDDQPISNENVGLMMFHPKLGAWWPCDSTTNETGYLQFKPVPAGMYTLRLKTETGMILEIKEVTIPPASTVNLGKIKPN